ncbi:MAG: hypothetical protein CL779_02050 [Chloroflexi bacterium]|nr:hypothetical protein [Chloroflexota bacterium]
MPNSNNLSNDICILICSYDGAEDLWLPLSETYKNFWPDCPFKIYLGTNEKTPSIEPFIPLKIGSETSWSDNIIKCIEKIDQEYILMIFDDIFLYKEIDTKKVIYFSELAVENNWSCLRLSPLPKYDYKILKGIGRIHEDRLYRTATVWSLFKKEVLKDLLKAEESAWDFEIYGSERSNKYSDFYSVDTTVLPYLNGVVKGKWVRKVYKYLYKEGFSVSSKNIKIMTIKEDIYYQYVRLRSWIFRKIIPNYFQHRIRKFFLN